jgi:hypothetical protein
LCQTLLLTILLLRVEVVAVVDLVVEVLVQGVIEHPQVLAVVVRLPNLHCLCVLELLTRSQ